MPFKKKIGGAKASAPEAQEDFNEDEDTSQMGFQGMLDIAQESQVDLNQSSSDAFKSKTQLDFEAAEAEAEAALEEERKLEEAEKALNPPDPRDVLLERALKQMAEMREELDNRRAQDAIYAEMDSHQRSLMRESLLLHKTRGKSDLDKVEVIATAAGAGYTYHYGKESFHLPKNTPVDVPRGLAGRLSRKQLATLAY